MKILYVSCPTCRKETEYSEDNKFRPFCSVRCKTQDIAAWAAEEYRVPSKEPVSEFDIAEALEKKDD